MDSVTKTSEGVVLDSDGRPEGKACSDCGEFKTFDQFQNTPKGGKARDCKACRRRKYEQGIERARDNSPVTKEWVVREAKRLYERPMVKLQDQIKLLDTIARNISGEGNTPIDDAKVIRDLIASKKRMKELGR